MLKNIKLNRYAIVFLISVFIISGSDDSNAQENKSAINKNGIVDRNMHPVKYSRASRLYQLNCAVCHGKHGEGAKDWRTPDKDGKNKPPPLNGTGHTWHHSPAALALVIRNGTGKIGGNMPAWKDKLSGEEITLILSWITAQWPDEIYTAWYNRFYQQK